MPNSPFPISGTVYDLNGTSVLAGARVGATNFTKGEKLPGTMEAVTDANGQFTIDLANNPTQWANSDVIYVYAYIKDKNAVARASITAGDAFWNVDLYMKEGDLVFNDAEIRHFSASAEAAISFSIIERNTDITRSRLILAANSTEGGKISDRTPLFCKDGFYVLRSAQATNIKSQAAGVANVIGDTSTNDPNVVTVVYS